MKNDEFNAIKINNESSTTSFEYGKTQKVEFSSYKDNGSLKDADLQTSDVSNEKIEEQLLNRHEDVKKELETAQKLAESSETASQAATTSGAVASATSAAGAVSTTVAAVASVVAVTSVGAAAGLNILNNQDATAELTFFRIFENQIQYNLVLKDSTENDKFIIQVENNNYIKANALIEGENEGSFEGLTQGETYNVIVKEDKFAGRTLLERVFTTNDTPAPIPVPEPPVITREFLGLVWDKTANFRYNIFEIALNYVDDEVNPRFSDFEFYLANSEYPSRSNHTFSLIKTTDTQVLSTYVEDEYNLDIRNSTFNYKLSYKDNGEVVVGEQGTVKFTDNSGLKTYVDGLFWDKTVDFTTGQMRFSLNYEDPFETLSNVRLTMKDLETGISGVYSIEITTEEQTILFPKEPEGQEEQICLNNIINDTFECYLFYEIDGVEGFVNLGDNVSFTDAQIAEYHGITVESAVGNTPNYIPVKLNYVDTNESIFQRFSVEIILENPTVMAFDKTFDLYLSHHWQYIDVSNSNFAGVASRNEDATFTLKITALKADIKGDNEEEVELETMENFSFDTSIRNGEMIGLMVTDNVIYSDNNAFDVTLVFVDDYSYISNQTIVITTSSGNTYLCPLNADFSVKDSRIGVFISQATLEDDPGATIDVSEVIKEICAGPVDLYIRYDVSLDGQGQEVESRELLALEDFQFIYD